MGYYYVGISGGEPLLWPDLEDFLRTALDIGFTTGIVTNGTLLTPKRAQHLKGLARVIAVSVDGSPDAHAVMRGSATAFARMREGLAALRSAGVQFVLAFTLTLRNADQLTWLYEFAEEEKAFAVEIHPLCNFGAASVNLGDAIPDSTEFQAAAWLLAVLREQRGVGGPEVVFDVVRRSKVEQSCWPLLTGELTNAASLPFSDLVPSLIVEPDGCLVPFIYGFPRRWAVGSIDEGPLSGAAKRWREEFARPVAGIVQMTIQRLRASDAVFVDLFGELLSTARQPHFTV